MEPFKIILQVQEDFIHCLLFLGVLITVLLFARFLLASESWQHDSKDVCSIDCETVYGGLCGDKLADNIEEYLICRAGAMKCLTKQKKLCKNKISVLKKFQKYLGKMQFEIKIRKLAREIMNQFK